MFMCWCMWSSAHLLLMSISWKLKSATFTKCSTKLVWYYVCAEHHTCLSNILIYKNVTDQKSLTCMCFHKSKVLSSAFYIWTCFFPTHWRVGYFWFALIVFYSTFIVYTKSRFMARLACGWIKDSMEGACPKLKHVDVHLLSCLHDYKNFDLTHVSSVNRCGCVPKLLVQNHVWKYFNVIAENTSHSTVLTCQWSKVHREDKKVSIAYL